MKVRVLGPRGLLYDGRARQPGEDLDVPDELGKDLIKRGLVKRSPPRRAKRAAA